MKRALWIAVVLALALGAAQADIIGWTCTISTSCNTSVACIKPEGGTAHPLVSTERCCPPPCQFPCEIQPCTSRVVGVSCSC